MRWSIRNQILLPVAGVVLLAVAAATGLAAVLAARDREQATLDQLGRVVATLAEARFPVSDTVVAQMRGLTGAHFIVLDDRRQLVASTLALPPTDLARLADLRAGELATLPRQPAVALGAGRYLIAGLERPANPAARWLYVLAPEGNWRREQWLAALYPLSVGAMAVLLTAGVAFALGQRLARRLRTLQGQTAAIARGEFAAIPPQGVNDELRDLEESVNRMAERLRELQATVAEGERQRVLAQLAGGLAHQLRNAATGARLALQLHAQRCHPAPGDQSLDVGLRQLSLLEMQVRGLLSLGKPERREPALISAPALLAGVIPLIEPACEHGGVILRTETSTGPGEVLGDAQALQAAVLNLALNAIEAAGRGGVVELRHRLLAGKVLLEVADSGPGPHPAVARHLGQPFVTTKPEGVGLGLLLVRQVAHDHGGTLDWSRREGQTVFTLKIPSTTSSGPFPATVVNGPHAALSPAGTQAADPLRVLTNPTLSARPPAPPTTTFDGVTVNRPPLGLASPASPGDSGAAALQSCTEPRTRPVPQP